MRGRNGRIIAAAIGWLTLAAAPVPNNSTPPKQPQPGTKIEQALGSIAKSQAEAVNQAKPGEYQKPCSDGQRNYQSELCAQWYAARAARDAADWAWWALFVAILGALGLGFTLWFNYRLLRIAQNSGKDAVEALKIAARNADAATRLAENAEHSTNIDLRAYITVSAARCTHLQRGFAQFYVDINNSGRTPAKKVFIEYGIWIGAHRTENPQSRTEGILKGNAPNAKRSIGAGDGDAARILTSNLDIAAFDTNDPETSLFLFGKIRYWDVFGARQETCFCFRNGAGGFTAADWLVFHPQGNDAT